MRRYRHIFFDLDHTLWDLSGNSRDTLHELFVELDLEAAGVPDAGELIAVYEEINRGMWEQYGAGRMTKEVLRVLRFRTTLMHFGVNNAKLVERLAHAYIERGPHKKLLMPGAKELLNDLQAHYRLHIITNGFDEVQHVKLKSSGIAHHFGAVLTSEKAGAHKPDPRIFQTALRLTKAVPAESLMVGDSAHTDMLGARNAGWDHVHFAEAKDHDALATYRIQRLDELREILL